MPVYHRRRMTRGTGHLTEAGQERALMPRPSIWCSKSSMMDTILPSLEPFSSLPRSVTSCTSDLDAPCRPAGGRIQRISDAL